MWTLPRSDLELRTLLLDHQGTAQAHLLLQLIVGVVPVGAGLDDRIFDEHRTAGRKGILGDLGDAVHVVGDHHAVGHHDARRVGRRRRVSHIDVLDGISDE